MDEGVAAALERAVRADANDFSSRNKLRLLRVCRALCPPDAASDMAIVLQCLLTVDPILYDLLGCGSPPVRASLADFCAWDQNPIARAQHRIVERLQAWGEDGASVGRSDSCRCQIRRPSLRSPCEAGAAGTGGRPG